MTNRLQFETSPYLLQHQHNPVDWYPWGPEALERARTEDKLMLVSIGYSACHWCHVMAHESFENPDIAALMNKWFVCVKVDREERPDIDAIYMSAVQAMSGHGGWPLNVFVVPDGTPVFGGTYWPPDDSRGQAGFPRVLQTLARAWQEDRENLLASASKIREMLRNSRAHLPEGELTAEVPSTAVANLREQFDGEHGGFGTVPKFPQAPVLDFLLCRYALSKDESARDMALHTLREMAAGGIHDHLGGGFARYSVDAEWHVPHFEKMLYDNAQLLSLYVAAYKLSGESLFREVAHGIVTWANRELRVPAGAWCAALDADSEGVEGKYYVWTDEEVQSLLSHEAADLIRLRFGVTSEGNFEHGTSILHGIRSVEQIADATGESVQHMQSRLQQAMDVLLEARAKRVPPGRDNKVITSWNAMMISALCQYADIAQEAQPVAQAIACAEFLFANLTTEDGHLQHTWNAGQTRGAGVLEDYACLAAACLELYRVTADTRWYTRATHLIGIVQNEFGHESGVGFYDTGINHESLVTRPRELQDGASPSGNAVMAHVLLTLSAMQQDERLEQQARTMAEGLARAMVAYPTAFGHMLVCSERLLSGLRELVFAGEPEHATIESLRQIAASQYLPNVVVGFSIPGTTTAMPMTAERPAVKDGAAWLCENRSCLPPISSGEDLAALLNRS